MFVPQTCCRASGQAGTWEFPDCLLVLGGVGPSLAPPRWEAVSRVGLVPVFPRTGPGVLCQWEVVLLEAGSGSPCDPTLFPKDEPEIVPLGLGNAICGGQAVWGL